MRASKPLGSSVTVWRIQLQLAGFSPPTRTGAGCGPSLELAWALKPAFMDTGCPWWPWGCQWPIRTPQLKAFGHALVLLKSAGTMQLIQAGTELDLDRSKQKGWDNEPSQLLRNYLPADGHKTVFTEKAKLIFHNSPVRQLSFHCLSYKSREASTHSTANIK